MTNIMSMFNVRVGYFFMCFFVFSVFNYAWANDNPELNKIIQSAENGDLRAQYTLGSLYYYGEEIDIKRDIDYKCGQLRPLQRDRWEAAKWFQKAAEQGHIYSQYRMGEIYESGIVREKNYEKSIEWFQKAASQGHEPSRQRMERVMDLEKQRKRALIKKGPFYSLPGGEFLDAIYRNDKEEIEDGSLYSWDEIPPSVSMVIFVANKYMYAYQFNWNKCCTPPKNSDKISKTFSVTIQEKKYENLYGMDMGSVPGWTSSAHYIVPKEFSFLLDKLGHNMGSDVMELAARRFKWGSVLEVFKGIDQLQKDYDCDSIEIKQFEKNLISLTTGSINEAEKNRQANKQRKNNTKAPVTIKGFFDKIMNY